MNQTKKYTLVTAMEFAERMLFLYPACKLAFATHYETDEKGGVCEDSLEDWFGAKILNIYDGCCLLVGNYGGGRWFSYDLGEVAGEPTIESVESVVSYHLFRDLKIPGELVCVENSDDYIEEKWRQLSEPPFDEADVPGDMILAEDWWIFQKGTDRQEIWKWFDKRHSKGVAYLLYGEEKKEGEIYAAYDF